MSTLEKPSHNEEEYFARREAELIRARQAAAREAARAAERRTHYMKCPHCGADLVTEERHALTVDRCPECQGLWLDAEAARYLLRRNTDEIDTMLRDIAQDIRHSGGIPREPKA